MITSQIRYYSILNKIYPAKVEQIFDVQEYFIYYFPYKK
jgi:hypothetical protein